MNQTKKILGFTGLVIAMFMGVLDGTVVNIALPDIMNHFKASLADTSWVSTIYVLALAIFTIIAAKIADQYGRKKVMLIGLIIFGSFSAASMFAQNLFILSIFRFIQGIGGAMITPVVIPMGIEVFGKAKLSLITSIIAAVSALSAAGGPPLGGIILQYSSWRWIFGINVPMALIAFFLVLIFLHESYDETSSKKIDFIGTITLTLALFGITFGLLKGQDYGWNSLAIMSSLILGLIMIVLFILVEKHSAFPMLELDLFKIRPFTASSLVFFIISVALICPSLIFNYFLQNVLNYSALSAALVIIPVSLTTAVAMPLGSRLTAKIGASAVNFAGMLILGLSLSALSLIQTDTPKSVMIVFLILNGFGFGFATQSMVSAIKPLPVYKSGVGSGIVNTARQLGMCLGIAVLVSLLDAHIDLAKQQIRTDSISVINTKILSKHVKTVAKHEIRQVFKKSSKSTTTSSKNAVKQMTAKIKQAAQNEKNLPKPRKNSNLRKLYDASQKLNLGSQKLVTASTSLAQGTAKLGQANSSWLIIGQTSQHIAIGNGKIAQGQSRLTRAIALVAQASELKSGLRQVKSIKNDKITTAFRKTYLFAAALVLLCSPIAWWSGAVVLAQDKVVSQ